MRTTRFRCAALGVATALAMLAGCVPEPPGPTPIPSGDRAVVALDVVPAGAYTTPSFGDVGREARMYDSITPLGASVTDADVAAGFKSAALDLPAGAKVRERFRPRAGVEIVRDEFNVPHVAADSDLKAVWAVGWLSAAHSPVMYEAARRNGRVAALGVPGENPVGSAFGFQLLDPSSAADAALDAQLAKLAALGAEGRAVLDDISAFVKGYNAQLDSVLSPLPRWTPRDIVALSAFKAEWWGRGSTAFVFPEGPGLEGGPIEPVTPTVAGDVRFPTRYASATASHFALVSGGRSTTGHPLLIGGPQIGYMYPGVAFEVVVNSPSIHMRGLTAPAYPGYVFVGRGAGFAWTLNVASDATTGVQFPIAMCGDGETSYVLDGACVPVATTFVGSLRDLANPFGPPRPVTLRTTAFGALDWIDTLSGTGYVIQRPGIGSDVLDLVAFRAVNHGETAGPEEFRAALQRSPQAFYLGYVDDEHIAAFGTCACADVPADRLPPRDPAALLRPVADLPVTIDPPRGVVTNWNEPMRTDALDFVPPGPDEYRGDWYAAFDSIPVLSPTTLVGAMNGVATQYSDPGSTTSFYDVNPAAGGRRPPALRSTDRSTAIQLVMSFGPDDSD